MTIDILNVAPSNNGDTMQLKGDMLISLDFVPKGDYSVVFVTTDANEYELTSTTSLFRQIDGTVDQTLKIGGAALMAFRLMYNSDLKIWDIGENNIIMGAGGGGSGMGKTKEHLLVQDAAGKIYPDKKYGNNFRVVANSNMFFGNPIGYEDDAQITITVVQGAPGGWLTSYDTQYALPDAQPLSICTDEKAISRLTLNATNDPLYGVIWMADVEPAASYQIQNNQMVPVARGYGLVTALAQIGTTQYYQMGVPLGSTLPGAMFQIQDGQTIEILRNGKGPEVTGTIPVGTANDVHKVFRLIGKPVGSGAERRPMLQLRYQDRPSFGKALLNFEGKGVSYVTDLRVSGARNIDSDARGICHNADAHTLYLNNVEITDCNNGILTGNDDTPAARTMFCDTYMYDVAIDRCGIGGPSTDPGHNFSTVGFTHSVYFGHNKARVEMTRCSLTNSIQGDNLKCRTGTLILNQVMCKGAVEGRELELPNGGWLEAYDCVFWKSNTSGGTGNTCLVGGNGMPNDTVEGLDTTRPRRYLFVNCTFRCDLPNTGRDMMFICNLDPDVPLEFVDCEFLGAAKDIQGTGSGDVSLYAGTVTVNGIRYKPSAPPIFTYTGGPLGPRRQAGYVPIPMQST